MDFLDFLAIFLRFAGGFRLDPALDPPFGASVEARAFRWKLPETLYREFLTSTRTSDEFAPLTDSTDGPDGSGREARTGSRAANSTIGAKIGIADWRTSG